MKILSNPFVFAIFLLCFTWQNIHSQLLYLIDKKDEYLPDLHIEQNGKEIKSSISANNSFEVVDFVTTSNAPLTIRIYRYSNSGSGNVLLGYHMRENF